MKLTEYGLDVRTLRMKYDVSLKALADHLGIGSSYQSAMEYGEKKLADKYVEATAAYFTGKGATAEEIRSLRNAAARSKDVVEVAELEPSARHLVAAFARRLSEGQQPTEAMAAWLDSRHGHTKKERKK